MHFGVRKAKTHDTRQHEEPRSDENENADVVIVTCHETSLPLRSH